MHCSDSIYNVHDVINAGKKTHNCFVVLMAEFVLFANSVY